MDAPTALPPVAPGVRQRQLLSDPRIRRCIPDNLYTALGHAGLPIKACYRVPEVARLLGTSVRTVYDMTADGRLPIVSIPSRPSVTERGTYVSPVLVSIYTLGKLLSDHH